MRQKLEEFVIDVEAVMQRELFENTINVRPSLLPQAMQYVVMSGGKRVRPLFLGAAGMLAAANLSTLAKIAAAVEFIHCYSLVHDDLPAMDNDDLRRGQPTCHKKYGEAIAILVGDALQSLAFRLLTRADLGLDNIEKQLKITNLIADSIGVNGMVGGQVMDLLFTGKLNAEGQQISLTYLQQMHSLKTGKLIQASILAGYLSGPETSMEVASQLTVIASNIGLLFQIIDDIIDVTSDTKTLGKTANKDYINNKITYVSVLGLEESQKLALDIYQEVLLQLERIPNSQTLIHLVEYIYKRNK